MKEKGRKRGRERRREGGREGGERKQEEGANWGEESLTVPYYRGKRN